MVVEPDAHRVGQVADDVVSQEAVLGRMQFDSTGFPGQLDVLPANLLDEIGLDEGILHAHSRQAAYPDVDDMIPAHDAVTNDGRRFHVPVLGTDVQCHAIGVAQNTIFDDPVIPAAGGNHSALRDRERIGRMFEGDTFNPDVVQPTRPGSKYLLLDHQLNLVLGRVRIAWKSHVDRQPVVLTPEGALLLSEVPVEFDLLQPLSIHEHHPAP